MAQSKYWTAKSFWHEATRDAGNLDNIGRYERFDLITRAVQHIGSTFYDLYSNFYMTEQFCYDTNLSKRETGTGGTYTTATKTLVLNSPSSSITINDIGKLVTFSISTSIYYSYIYSYVSASSFTVLGGVLPSADGTLEDVLILGTTPSGDEISIVDMNVLMNAGIKIEILTSETATVREVSLKEYDNFSTGGRNKKTIVWCLQGTNIKLKKGSGLSSYGTLTMRFPRIPYSVTLDTDYIDLPDGTPIELGILYLKSLVKQRITGKKEIDEQHARQLVSSIYTSTSGMVNEEAIKDKITAIM
jgi:hypothetical protein